MSVRVMIESKVKEGALEGLKTFLEANLPNVRGFSGCLNVTVLCNEASGDMLFDEEWLSVDHHQTYIQFISDNGVMAELGGFLSAPPTIRYLNRLAI